MALTSKFIADFTSFYDAVQKATVQVKDLSKEADKAGGQFNKMVDSLSGSKIQQQATLMVKAVEAVGGASKLTDTELKRVNSTVTEAISKMEKLGVAVPKSFKEIQTATENVNKPTEGWGSNLLNLTNIVRGFMGLQIVSWFTDAAKAGFEWSSSMSKMHAQTDLSYRDLQILEDVAINTGSSLESLTKGVQVLQQRIGDKSASAGITALGLSFEEIRRMNAADQFAAIAAAIAKIPDSNERAARGFAVFGGTYREIAPAVRANIKDIAAALNEVGEKQIEAADKASARWEKFWNDQKKGWAAWGGNLVLGVEKGMSDWDRAQQRAEAIRRGGVKALLALDAEAAAIAAGPTLLNQGVSTFPQHLTQPPRLGQNVSAAEQARILKEQADRLEALRDIADMTASAMQRLTVAQAKQVEAASQAGASAATIAAAYGLNERAITNYLTAQKLLAQQIPMTNAAVAKFSDLVSHGQIQSGLQQINRDTEALTGTLEAWIKSQQKQAILFPDWTGKLDDWTAGMQKQQGVVKEWPPLMTTVNKHLGGIESILGGIQTGWAQMAVVGSRAVQSISAALAKGDWVGAIVAATAALVPFIAKLFGASEESKKVSPMRDEFFKLQGGLERLNPRVQELEGNLESVQAVFDAKTVQAYDAAIANLNKILAREASAFDEATDAANDYGKAIKNLPTKIPIDMGEGGTVPGFATGTGGQFVNFGSGTLAMLHGREAIVPESAVRSAGGGGGGTLGATVVINAQGAFFDTPGDLQRLADKVNDALTAKHGLTNRTRAA